MHRADVFFYFLLSFIIGVAMASFWTIDVRMIQFGIMAAAAIMGISSYHKTFGKDPDSVKKRTIGFLAGLFLLVAILGIYRFNLVNESSSVLYQLRDLQVGKEQEIDIEFNYIGYVASEPEVVGNRQQFAFRVHRVDVGDRFLEVDDKILVTTNPFPRYSFGDNLSVVGSIKSPENFGDFDYATYLRRDGILFITSFPEISETSTPLEIGLLESLAKKIYEQIFKVKNRFEESINKSVVEPQASYLNGILTGTRKSIPQDLKEAFATTSTSHVLAISGYNIAIIAQAMIIGLVWFMKRRRAFWLTVAVIIAFVILTGASASVVRAAIMGLLLIFANSYGRLYNPRNAIALAAALMILFNPFVLVFDVGFQLSFLAVIGLLYLYPLLKQRFKVGDSGLKDIILMTLSAQLFVLPFLIYYFNQLSLVSLLVNILILPFVPYTMLFGFLSGILGMIIAPLGNWLGWIAWALANYQLNVVQYFATISYASISVSINLFVTILLYVILIAWMKLLKRK